MGRVREDGVRGGVRRGGGEGGGSEVWGGGGVRERVGVRGRGGSEEWSEGWSEGRSEGEGGVRWKVEDGSEVEGGRWE